MLELTENSISPVALMPIMKYKNDIIIIAQLIETTVWREILCGPIFGDVIFKVIAV